MPKSVPPEFTGKFSIKRKRSPKRKGSSHSAGPAPKLSKSTTGDAIQRQRAESSASSTQLSSYGDVESFRPTINRTPDQYVDLSRGSPLSQSQSRRPSTPASSPHVSRPASKDDPSQAQSDLIETYQMLQASATDTPHTNPSTPLNIPTLHGAISTTEQDIYTLFSTSYNRHHSRAQLEPSVTRNVATALVDSLNKSTLATHSVHIHNIIVALHNFALEYPASIDFLLSCFKEATSLFPDTFETEYGRGSVAGLDRFRAWLNDELHDLDTDKHSEERLNRIDGSESPKGSYQHRQDIHTALKEIDTHRQQRREHIILAAINARAFALGLLKAKDARKIEEQITLGYNGAQARGRQRTDFVASCIMIRACGHALLDGWGREGEKKVNAWKDRLEELVLEERHQKKGRKVHAMVSLTTCPGSKILREKRIR